MKTLVSILSFLVLWPLSLSQAQLYPWNEAGVTLGSVHTIVRDVEVTKRFWALFGGQPITIGGIDVIKLPGVFVFMHPGEPSGPSRGAVVDHLGVSSPNPYELIKRLVGADVKTDSINPATLRDPSWTRGSRQQTWTHVYSPDGLRVAIETNPCAFTPPGSRQSDEDPCPEQIVTAAQHGDPAAPIGGSLLHFYLKDNAEEGRFRDFYAKYFGGKIIRSAGTNFVIPGAKLNVETSPAGPLPSNKGRALDSIGFEVKNLEEFCKKLEAAGVKFDQPYSKTRYKSFAHAAFIDAWGIPVQLTEGLKPVCHQERYQGPLICS
ncbi:MAG: hypothetical protein A3J28_15705 [Acidobacteria bacterium RIFCSPLOWO2_12_FULL_60_22]|nr:MAG: hypothetical protein A3J28_15705 [Acidobacteria bacterium RIFCSPLOWO2_12_FULL_60_22]